MAAPEINPNDIAVIGMGCRFPGAGNVDELWDVIKNGKVMFQQFSDDELRQSGVEESLIQNPLYVKAGYPLADVDKFDASLFGFSPKDAETLDPQHRFFLEVVWEALESAGYAPDNTGCVTGLFAGSSMSSYYLSQLFNNIDEESVTAALQAVLANDKDYLCTRTAYKLNFKGPCINVQTACSTSLVAVSQACDSLLDFQCDIAIAGGVTIKVPHNRGYLYEEGNILSSDGRCRTFADNAEGTVFGSGVGAVILKRLEDAVEDGDEIHAVIKSTSVNNDGAKKIAFSAPSVDGQSEVIAMAQAMADINPETISYVECHGTGTSLGDPIEVMALRQVFESESNKKNFCALGAIKSNVGHLESAAGIASLIKTILSIKNSQIPPSKHYQNPNPQIKFSDSPFYVNNELLDWPESDTPRRAGVSSFGMGGTNVHVIVEEAPLTNESINEGGLTQNDREQHLLTLSAKSVNALKGLAQKYIDYLNAEETSDNLGDISYTSHIGRSHFNHRLSLVGSSKQHWLEQLNSYLNAAEDDKYHGVVAKQSKIAFLYTGQGSQYPDMCKDLFETEQVFRDSLLRSESLLKGILEHTLTDVLYGEHQNKLSQTQYTQPALFSIEIALTELWESWGIQADFVMGHSLGEYVAACVRGVMSVADGLKLVCERGRLMQALPDKGSMLSALGNEQTIIDIINAIEGLEISAYNAPGNLVISGENSLLNEAEEALLQAGVKCKALDVAAAFHSALVEPMLDDFGKVLDQIKLKPAQKGFISNVTGQQADVALSQKSYWLKHIRDAVNYRAGMNSLVEAGVTAFIEIGPQPVLLGLARQNIDDENIHWLPSVRQNNNNHKVLLGSLAELYVVGADINWEAVDKSYLRKKTSLPIYAFQRKRYWVTEPSHQHKFKQCNNGHPLLGDKIKLAKANTQEIWFSQIISANQPKYLNDHKVYEQIIYPAAGYIEMALAVGKELLNTDLLHIENVKLVNALLLNEDREVQTVVRGNEDGRYEFEIYSQHNDDWLLHASGKIQVALTDERLNTETLDALRERINEPESIDELYAQYKNIGIDYGLNFQTIEELSGADGESLARIRLPIERQKDVAGYQFHPTLLDGVFQASAIVFGEDIQQQSYLPSGFDSIDVFGKPDNVVIVNCKLNESDETIDQLCVDIVLFCEEGSVLAHIKNLTFKKVSQSQFMINEKLDQCKWYYDVSWKKHALRPEKTACDFVPDITELSNNLNKDLYAEIVNNNVYEYQEFLSQLDKVSGEYIVSLFNELGVNDLSDSNNSVEEYVEQLRILPKYHQLVSRFLNILKDDGVVEMQGSDWLIKTWPDEVQPEKHLHQLLQQYPKYESEISLLKACGSNLSSILKGDIDATEIIFPNGDVTAASNLYHNSPILHSLNALTRSTISNILDELPKGRCIRVLEIGAGTGGTTSKIIDAFSESNTEYYFTDISQVFLSNAKEKYKAHGFIDYNLLDIEKDPEEQGFYKHQFDLIIASNVLHATKNLTNTISNVKHLLSSQGIVVLIEGTEPQRYLDIIFGLTDGWWHYEDVDLRQDYPLISTAQWSEIFLNNGFSNVISLPKGHDLNNTFSSQSLIVAKAAQEVMEKKSTTWLLCVDSKEVSSALSDAFISYGGCLITLSKNSGFDYQVDFTNRNEVENVLSEIHNEHQINGVMCFMDAGINEMMALDVKQLSTASEVINSALLHLTQGITILDEWQNMRLIICSQNAQYVTENDGVEGLLQSQLWGAAKVISLEYPELNCKCIDLDMVDVQATAHSITSEVFAVNDENQIAIRDGERYIARLARQEHSLLDDNELNLTFNDSASYIVTGGLGGLGKLVCSWLIDKGAGHVIILNHREIKGDETAWAEGFNGQLVIKQCQAHDKAQLETTIKEIEKEYGKLKGVIHAAGVLSDGMIMHQDMDKYEKVLLPKLYAAWNLHQCTKDKNLDYFVMFSSVAAVFGSAGQINHASANYFLDQLMHYRHAQGLAALSLNWGAWEQVGAAAEYIDQQANHDGLLTITPDEGLKTLEQFMLQQTRQIIVFPAYWQQVQSMQFDTPFYSDVLRAEDKLAIVKSDFIKRLEKADIECRRELLTEQVQQLVSKVLGVSVDELSLEQGFFDMGMDSLTSMDLRGHLQTSLSCYLPTTFVFNCPTMSELLTYLINQVLTVEFVGEQQEDVVVEECDAEDFDTYDNLSEDELNSLIDEKLESLDS